MTVLTPPVDLITTAVLTLLRTGGRVVFDGVYGKVPELVATNSAYAADPARPVYPFDVLYQIPGGDADPTPGLDDRGDTVVLAYQVSSVSSLRNQAQWQARTARDLLTGRNPATGGYATPLVMPAGWVCPRRWPDPAPPGVDRAGDPPNAVFTVPARYLIAVTPA